MEVNPGDYFKFRTPRFYTQYGNNPDWLAFKANRVTKTLVCYLENGMEHKVRKQDIEPCNKIEYKAIRDAWHIYKIKRFLNDFDWLKLEDEKVKRIYKLFIEFRKESLN